MGNHMQSKHIKILANLFLYLAGILLAWFLIPRFLRFFLPFVIGWILALMANPLVRFLEKRVKLVRKHGSFVIVVGVLAILTTLLYFLITVIVREAVDLIQDIPQIQLELIHKVQNIQQNIIKNHGEQGIVQNILNKVLSLMDGEADKLVSKLTGPTVEMAGNVAKEIPNIFINVIFTILSAYFFVADRDRIYSWADRVIPEFIKERWGWAKKLISNAIGGYFKAQFKIMCVIFAVLWLGLMILGVKYSILWAIFIAFLDMLPVFGTGSILLPWTLLEVLDGDYRQAVGLVILYLISLLLHQLLQPKMVGDSVGMDPLATLIVMFMGYRFYGVLGMIIAIPIGMILINLYRNGAFEQPMDEIRQLVKAFNQYRKS